MASQFITTPLPYFFIGKELTAQRFNNYNQRYQQQSLALGKPDTRSVWYSKEHIGKLFEEIENANGDGMRIYFGSYESSHQYAGQTCLLMVVTREEQMAGTSIHKNVSLEDEPGFDDRNALPKDTPPWSDDEDDSIIEKDFNHGSPCPPVCDGNGGFDFP